MSATTQAVLQIPPAVELKTQRTGLYDLTNFRDLPTLYKVAQFVPLAGTIEQVMVEAKKRLGTDANIITAINEGLKVEASRALYDDPTVPWMIEDEKGELTPFTGRVASRATQELVNNLVLTFAKSKYGYITRDPKAVMSDTEENELKIKNANAKEQALAFVRANPYFFEALLEPSIP